MGVSEESYFPVKHSDDAEVAAEAIARHLIGFFFPPLPTLSPTATSTPSPTPSPTYTLTPTATPTQTPTPTSTLTPTIVVIPEVTPTSIEHTTTLWDQILRSIGIIPGLIFSLLALVLMGVVLTNARKKQITPSPHQSEIDRILHEQTERLKQNEVDRTSLLQQLEKVTSDLAKAKQENNREISKLQIEQTELQKNLAIKEQEKQNLLQEYQNLLQVHGDLLKVNRQTLEPMVQDLQEAESPEEIDAVFAKIMRNLNEQINVQFNQIFDAAISDIYTSYFNHKRFVITDQRQRIYKCVKNNLELAREGLARALIERWEKEPNFALEEIYEIYAYLYPSPKKLANLLECLSVRTQNNKPDSLSRFFKYLNKVNNLGNCDDLSGLLSEGKDVYQEIAHIPGSDQIKEFYDVLVNLDQSLAWGSSDILTETQLIPERVRKVVESIRKTFTRPYQERLPLTKTQQALKQARNERYTTPEGKLLVYLIDKWLVRIAQINQEPAKYKPEITATYSTSLNLEFVEEDTDIDSSFKHIRIPFTVYNQGPGDALGLEIKVFAEHGPNFVKRDIVTLSLGELKEGQRKTEVISSDNYLLKSDHQNTYTFYTEGYFYDMVEGKRNIQTKRQFIFPRHSDIVIPDKNPYNFHRLQQIKSEPVFEFDETMDHFLKNEILTKPLRRGFVVIKGISGSGKSIFMREIWQRLVNHDPQLDVLPVYIDKPLQPQDTELQVDYNERLLFQIGQTISETANNILGTLNTRIESKEEKIKPEAFLNFLKAVIDETNQGQSLSLFIFFDEADTLIKSKDFRGFLEKIAELILDDGRLILAFAHQLDDIAWNSVWKQLKIYDPDKEAFSDATPLLLHTLNRPLLSLDSTMRLAMRQSLLDYTDLAKDYLWRLTGGHPSLVQFICHYLIEEWKTVSDPAIFDGLVHVADIKRIVKKIQSDDNYQNARQFVEELINTTLRDEEKCLLRILINNEFDLSTGHFTALHYDSTNTLQPMQGLVEEFDTVCKQDFQNCEQQVTDLFRIVQILEEKQIIERSTVFLSHLRLRIGILYNFLK